MGFLCSIQIVFFPHILISRIELDMILDLIEIWIEYTTIHMNLNETEFSIDLIFFSFFVRDFKDNYWVYRFFYPF